MTDLESFVKQISPVAAKNIEQYGELVPTVFLVSKDEIKIGNCAPFFKNNQTKSAFSQVLREMLAKDEDIQQVFLISEAWVVEKEDLPANPESVSAKDHPDRQEVVMISGEDRDGTTGLWTLDIVRTGDKVTLANLTRAPNGESEGRFCGWFPRPKTAIN